MERRDWLSRSLARAGVMPLAEAEDAIRAGRVALDGRVVRQPLAPVRPDSVVKIDGHRVSLAARTIVLAFHKPPGSLTSTVGQGGAPTVFEQLLPTLPTALSRHQWHAVGRLDKGTTGLLLFTNDERLVGHATSPLTQLPKRYLATVGAEPTEERLAPLRRGVELEDGRARPASARLRELRQVEVVVTEGRHHQVKRMLGAVGLPVLALHREAVGGVELQDLPQGAWRELTAEEIRDGLRFAPGEE